MAYTYDFKTADRKTRVAVWAKGKEIVDSKGKHWDPDIWRWDICGKPMKYSEHGNTDSKHGWEIDHIIPTAKGGPNIFENLQPLQWENNRLKSDEFPWFWP